MTTGQKNGIFRALIFGAMLGAVIHARAEVKLISPAGYLPNVPYLARVEVRDGSGARDWSLWNAEAILSVDQAGVSLSTNRVVLRNGLGTALLTISGSASFNLTATVNGERAARTVTNLTGQPVTTVSGTLPGTSTTWSGVVSITNSVTVPTGHTLTIQSNTLVLINGVASGTSGIRITVNGAIQSLGTEQHPVTMTTSNPNLNWGQIRHDNAQSSLYQYTFISKAGRAPGEGHTGTAPALRPNNSTLILESSVISDLTASGSTIGKIMMANGSTLTLRDSVLARARMGPEIASTGLVCTNSYILEMTGPDDGDGIYLHSAGTRSLTLSRCVLAAGTDDAVDTLDSNVTIEDCIIRDWPNPNEDAKGVSAFNGEVTLRRCLIANCFAGVFAKSSGPLCLVRIDRCTIIGLTQGVGAATKANASAGNINFYISNSVVQAPDAVYSDFGPDKFVSVTYCNLSESWPGAGNSTSDPLFVNAAAGDFRLQPGSPLIDAADPAAPLDADGTRTEIGYFTAPAKANVHPIVSFTSPANDTTFDAPASFTITATAQDPDGTISNVVFYANGTRLGEDSTSPYTLAWSDVPAGNYALSAVATDAAGLSTTSSVVNVTVKSTIPPAAAVEVVISEIMYHPASENPLEEFIELFNRGSSAVNLQGWRFSDGVEFTFPDVTIPAGGYLVVAADLNIFRNKYPGVANVVGNWIGLLNNSREDIDLDDAKGNRVDSVQYADEGDWAVRRRGPLDRNHRGWVWFAEHDGLGKSLELINPSVSNNSGQNWASSRVLQGTPGRENSVLNTETAPLIQNISHLPAVPRSTDTVRVTAQVSGQSGRTVTVTLNYRVDQATPPPFTALAMRDDGSNGDASAGDGIFSAIVPAQTNNTVVEFYVAASDVLGNTRTWPAPAIAAADGAGPTGQIANALFQVDNTVYTGSQPLYKLIMTENERAELAIIPSQSSSEGPNSQMNGTFISIDGSGIEYHYLADFRNRGHGSRTANPPNYHVAFRRDDLWKGVTELNLNSQQIHMQHFGSALANKSGALGTYSHAAQVRVNGVNRANAGGGMFGSYAANEVYGSDWAKRHLPFDGEGNVYRVVRDIRPPNFDYRGPNKNSYVNTYFKETNVSEDDWTDLIGMLQIMGENSGAQFTLENIHRVVNVEQWLTHLAVMNLFANGESGINTGNNDDYFMYRGMADRRFLLLFHDLDQILSVGSLASNTDIFRATGNPISGDTEGIWRAMARFLHSPDIEPLYRATLERLLDTTFSKPEFDTLIDQVLGSYVPQGNINSIKTWMDQRRTFVRSQLGAIVVSPPPMATLSGAPRSPTPRNSATLTVAGPNVTHYQYSLNNAPYGPETPMGTPIQLANLANGTNTIAVIGRNAAGVWQAPSDAAVRTWIVDPAWPTVRLNEVLAWNATAVNRSGTFPDAIELYNEGAAPVNLSGLRLSDDQANPSKYTFASGATLASGAYLVLDANQLGFSLDQTGEGVYLFHSTANGGALLDSVEFGFQVADLSMGRLINSDDWILTQPTLGSVNVPQTLGDSRQIKINEWLAFGASPYPDDFIELYNPQSLPVELGGHYLTDQPAGAPKRSGIAPLSFIPPRGYRVFTSGNGNRPSEINFSLASEQGELALLAPDLSIIDSVVYGPQRLGVTTGRCPDGAAAQRVLETPTPGGPNQCPSVPAAPQSVTLIPFNHVWKYEASGTDLGTTWKDTNYTDTAWRSGPGLLGFEPDPLPQPLLTSFANAANPTYYFRTQFNVDPGLAASSIQVTHFVDDGAAFYLNGREVTRYNLAAGAGYRTFATANLGDATSQTFTIPADQLRPGVNYFAAEVHQINATSSDVTFGLMMQALVLTNSAAQSGIVINEVLAFNDSLEEPDGRKPDWIELYNPSAITVDLAGLSLSDDVANPRRWIFSTGSVLPGKGFLKIAFNPDAAQSASNTGFALKANGGAVFLFNRPSDGSGLQSAVTYGLQAADWSIGRVPDGGTNWVLNIPTLGTANIAASLGNPQLLRINEWMADPISGDDWFEIFNPNPQPVDLSRFWLSDSLSTVMKHSLPALSFIGSGAHAFQQFTPDENPAAGADHVNFKLSASGDALALSATNGTLIDGLSFGAQITGVSQGRLPDGGASIVNFTVSPTPGNSNFLPLNNVFINELLSHTDPPLEDAVELYNASTSAVDISGWFLSDSAQSLRKFPIPANTTIPAGGYVVFYESQFNRVEAGHEPFSFSSARGEEVYLSQSLNGNLTGYRAFAAFDAAENGVSFGRVSTSQGFHFVPMARRTFGRDNPATTNEFVFGTGAPNADAKVGPVVISEIMYHPAGTNDVLEFVELHNVSAAAVPLYDPANPANSWRLRKGIDFDFPTGTSLPAGGFLVVVSFNPQTDAASLAAFRSAYGTAATLVGPYSGKLKDSGDTIELQKADPPQTVPGPDFGFVPYILVDRIDYRDTAPWPASADGTGPSLHKSNHLLYGNDPANWTGAAPSPGTGPSVAVPGDSDNDGLPNDWEIANGLNPNDPADARLDSDGDGLTNLQEYLAGTNPRNTASALKAGVRINASGGLALEFTAAANRTYTIEFRDSLTSTTWQKLTDIASTPSERVLQWPITTSGSVRFFRIVLAQ